MYWADAGTNKVHRANLDGSGIEELLTVTDPILSPLSIALDLGGGKMYIGLGDYEWQTDGKIQRANLDGSGVEELIPSDVLPWAIALDLAGGKLYWAYPGIHRANLDGSQVELLIIPFQPIGIALDLRRNEIPAISDWGLLVMGVVVVLAGCVVLGRRRARPQRG